MPYRVCQALAHDGETDTRQRALRCVAASCSGVETKGDTSHTHTPHLTSPWPSWVACARAANWGGQPPNTIRNQTPAAHPRCWMGIWASTDGVRFGLCWAMRCRSRSMIHCPAWLVWLSPLGWKRLMGGDRVASAVRQHCFLASVLKRPSFFFLLSIYPPPGGTLTSACRSTASRSATLGLLLRLMSSSSEHFWNGNEVALGHCPRTG